MKNQITKFIAMDEIELKASKSEDMNAPLYIEGYANVAKPDRGNELMPQSCWDLANYKKNPVVCINHQSGDINSLVGTAEVEARPEGLWFKATIGDPSLAPLTDAQNTARSLIKQKILKGISVGFIPKEYNYDPKTELLTYKEAELYEFSLVTVPMQQDSFIMSIKGLHAMENKEIIEEEKSLNISMEVTEESAESKESSEQESEEVNEVEQLKEQVSQLSSQLQSLSEQVQLLQTNSDTTEKGLSNLVSYIKKLRKLDK